MEGIYEKISDKMANGIKYGKNGKWKRYRKKMRK